MGDREVEPVRRPMTDSYEPQHLNQPSCIAFQPNINGNMNLSCKLLNTLLHFSGDLNENPHLHIKDFFDICKMQSIQGLTPKQMRLILFPFLLKSNAKLWMNSLDAGSIHS
ncbi:hypothetical protein D8674_026352 [Pyrus ussuriensis x Pyrus communis]|uniref:Uncharacterized protein n=1 Tax=Pyrus ussuriensis x Pyrus communis TaxID=2448454 RepID=A0A5N5I7P5_9ROSA|nr:hypothetical protein D8674_026352 [Pyrus ussuriensis x Pyrus communis]